ncbi:HAMP domain-containing protein [Glaciecola sp. MH2013]|uniref:ATP-binding protein n=1 Tax=Glaciecola sp. MH2013 TaxID=2785524 RepID=UPI0018A065A7|nr:ATP-binding protein [Glaciecola sp. MH2013]MBF7073797.1 HAMP domain-containing protein [Glaciecola sp. MH2013]
MRLQQLNPFNYLFGRVFVWFWVALLVIVFSAFFLARQLSTTFEINAATPEQIAVSAMVKERIERQLNNERRISSALRRASERGKLQLVTINDVSGDLRSNFPPPLVGNVEKLRELSAASGPVLISLNNMQFVGPHKIDYRGESYSLFVGRLLLRGERPGPSRSTGAIAGLSLAIVLSTAFCFLLVLGISRPIGALRKASNALSQGALSTRIEGFKNRKDEIGLLADDFNSMAERLQQVVENQKQLMANVSHELRTPLTRLQLSAALLEDANSHPDNPNKKQVDRIQNEIQKMDKMIGHALTIAKLNSDSENVMNSAMVTTSLDDLLSSVLDDASFEAQALSKSLEVSLIPDSSMKANGELLASAIENILRNGLRFAKSLVRCELELNSGEHSTTLTITIEDDGPGMPLTQVNQIFDPFFRGSEQSSQSHKGAGLGLAIAKAAVEVHGGNISAQASQLGGLSVIIRLPIST